MSTVSLTPNQDRLLRRCRTLNYGTVHDLHVRDGDPQFDPPPRLLRSVRFPENAPPRPMPATFVPCRDQLAFLHQLTEFGDGVVPLIKVHEGRPVLAELPVPV